MPTPQRAFRFKQQLLILYYGLVDARTPFYVKLPAIAALIYIVSPVDFIPDFIPFAGYIDDLLIAPLLLNLSIKLLPVQVRETSLVKARKKNILLTIAIIVAMLLVLLLIVALFISLKKIFWY